MGVALSLLALFALVATSCASGGSIDARPQAGPAGDPSRDDQRTLVISMRWEPATLTRTSPSSQGVTPGAPWQLFHAALTSQDHKGTPHTRLAEGFPRLGTDSWKVFPDGRMEATWRLRPNLTWHDGAPLVADDFVLSRRFAQAAGATRETPEIDEVVAADSRTVVIRFNAPTAEAGQSILEPFAHHILAPLVGPDLEQLQGRDIYEAFSFPYFTTEFVGMGAYRLERWEPGAFITGVAFPGYVGGKPSIRRVQLLWIADANTSVANLLSGAVHLATDLSLSFDQVPALRREWTTREGGVILLSASRTRYVQVQYRPDYVRPTALLDVRFRQALAHAIDKQAIVEVMLDGEPGIAETLIPKEAEYYPDLDRVLTKHPFDPRRAEQLLAELGLAKDAEGFYRQDGNRISLGLISLGGYDPREALVLSDSWKRVGIEAPIRALSPAEQLDGEIGSTYPSLAITHVGIQADLLLYNPLVYFTAALVSSPATRWLGRNRGAYADPEMERLAELYAASLDRNVRNQAIIQGMKLLSEQAAYFPLYYGFDVVAHAGSLAGPPGALRETALWNAESWSWK